MEASRRRYRVQMKEAAVVGEGAELRSMFKHKWKAWRLAWRRDPTEPTLVLTKAIHSFTSLSSPRSCSCSCSCSTCHSFSLPHLDPL